MDYSTVNVQLVIAICVKIFYISFHTHCNRFIETTKMDTKKQQV